MNLKLNKFELNLVFFSELYFFRNKWEIFFFPALFTVFPLFFIFFSHFIFMACVSRRGKKGRENGKNKKSKSTHTSVNPKYIFFPPIFFSHILLLLYMRCFFPPLTFINTIIHSSFIYSSFFYLHNINDDEDDYLHLYLYTIYKSNLNDFIGLY